MALDMDACDAEAVITYIKSHPLCLLGAAWSPELWIVIVFYETYESQTVKIHPEGDHDASCIQRE